MSIAGVRSCFTVGNVKIFFVLSILFSSLYFSQVLAGSSPPPPPPPALPTISPAGGYYEGVLSVTITGNSQIRYTLDGSTPVASSPVYTTPITLTSATTLKARGVRSTTVNYPYPQTTYSWGSVATAIFDVATEVATPTISPPDGAHPGSVSVTLATNTPGATIHYTMDGTNPTNTSPVYNGSPIQVAQSAVIKTVALKSTLDDSNVSTAIFNIQNNNSSNGNGGVGGNATPGQNDLVGSTPGNFSVGSSGAANYSIPIAAAAGTGGVEPKLSLDYSSQGRNGLLGVGWSISGLSNIHRCPTNIAKDGFIDGIDFDENDRFCLDGQPLIAVDSNGNRLPQQEPSYGASGTEYRTEINNFSRIISYGSTGNGPSHFKVWTKSGEVMEYGKTPNSQINPPLSGNAEQTDAICWLLNKVSDTTGNYMDIEYFENESTGENYPFKIDYTGNTTAGTSPFASIEFMYEDRPDVGKRYLSGLEMVSTMRLKTIYSKNNGGIVKEYQLAYSTSPDTGRSVLSELTECNANGACLDPTEFEWEESTQRQWVSAPGFNPPTYPTVKAWDSLVDNGVRIVDVNGDGLQDFVYGIYWSGGSARRTWLNTGNDWLESTEYAPPYFITLAGNDTQSEVSRFVDLNGDNLPDFVYGREHHATKTWMNTGSGWTHDPNYSIPVPIGNEVRGAYEENGVKFADLDGDGLTDLLYSGPDGKGAWLNTGSGWQVSAAYKSPARCAQYEWRHLQELGCRLVDLNGDGLQDLVQSYYWGGDGRRSWINTGSGWQLSPEYKLPKYIGIAGGDTVGDGGVRFVDLNNDGLQDILYGRSHDTRSAWMNSGEGWMHAPHYASPEIFGVELRGAYEDHGARIVDVNGDGLPDIISGRYWNSGSHSKRGWINTGSGWIASSDYISPQHMTAYAWRHLQDHGVRFADLDGDGDQDILYGRLWGDSGSKGAYLNAAIKSDQLKTVTNGLGIEINIDYEPLTNPDVYTKGDCVGPACHPTPDLIGPLYVVKETNTDNGIGSQNTLTYTYADAKVGVQGRGMLGFASRTVTDVETDTVVSTTYRQDFPYIGQVYSDKTTVDGVLVSEEYNNYFASGNVSVGPVFPYPTLSISRSYDLNSEALLSTTITENFYDDFGNPTRIIVRTNDEGLGEYRTTTDNIYSSSSFELGGLFPSGTTGQHLGRLMSTQVKKEAPGQEEIIRNSVFDYNAATGLLNMETIEPGVDELVKVYTHDAFGNRIMVTESGNGIASRTTQTAYDAKGQFPISVTNAMGHTETRTLYDAFGNVGKLTGPNQIDTSWSYDLQGRKKQEIRADGTESAITYAFCGSSCPSQLSGLASYKMTTVSTGAPTSTQYFDRVGRVILTETQSFAGGTVYVQTEYDDQGRVSRKSNPYFLTNADYWTEYTYDNLNRVLTEVSPVTGTTSYSYDGFVVTTTNSKNQTTKEFTNSLNQTQWAEDDNGNQIEFEYDSSGNLITVTDSEDNVTTNTYDLRGFKIAMVDPDMGAWKYEYNVLGELTQQWDAKTSHSGPATVSMTYDILGRLVERNEAEGQTTWVYDTATKGIGKLTSVSNDSGYSRSHTYDNLGRPSSNTTVIGGASYTTSTSYDAYGRVDGITYPSGFKVEQQYNVRGFLEHVRNANNTSEVYYTAQATDQFGNVTVQTLGHDASAVTTFRSFKQNSGRLQHINSTVQSLQYNFDALGNLTQRKENGSSGRTENFTYDNLNRLVGADVVGAGTKSFTYDDLGNITYKSDVGNYIYGAGAAGPHAVTSTTGVLNNTYTYDANGNQLIGDGKTTTWSSFNKPVLIQKGSSSSVFTYGPDRARYLQTTIENSITTTTTYIGGLYEVVEKGTSVEKKHFIRAGSQTIAIYTDRSSGADSTHYLHRDHLGSIETITNASGAIVEKLSFDAFGKRRLSSWDDGVPNIQSNNTRGFTGHEMLDAVGLIHMNGRVYDPTLGRFLSADPNMQFPKNMQNYNRYSYVVNNPLSYTDPSGFFLKKLFKSIAKPLQAAVKAFSGALKNPYVRLALGIAAAAFTAGAAYGAYISNALNTVGFNGLTAATFTTAKVVAGAAGGFVGGLVASGGDLRAAAVGGITGGAAGFIGASSAFNGGPTIFGNTAKRVVAHGVVGGASAEAQGGKFGQGFVSGAFNKAVASPIQNNFQGNPIGGGIASAIVGGTASVLSGGKFANAARTSAFAYLFNEASGTLQRAASSIKSLGSRLFQEIRFGANAVADGIVDDYKHGGFWEAVTYATGGRTNEGFLEQISNNFESTSIVAGPINNIDKKLVALTISSAVTKSYGGYSALQYARHGIPVHLPSHATTIRLVAGTTLTNAVVITGSYELGNGIGSFSRTVINRGSRAVQNFFNN
jgi:RHS repeat-associated protein